MKQDKINLIQNIKEQDQFFFSGTLYPPMFEKEIDVWIEKEADLEYAERCAEQFTGLNTEIVDFVCRRICDYHSYMLEEWNEEFVREINEKVPPDAAGREILRYIENPTLFVIVPQGEGIGYSVSGSCEWDPEHGIEIIIRDSRPLYVGQTDCLGAWASDDEYLTEY